MHHAAVAPRLVPRDLGLALEHRDAQTRMAAAQLARGGEPEDAGADDGDVAALGWRGGDLRRHFLYPRRRAGGSAESTGTMLSEGASAVKVRDLEIAMVLAREMKAAAARSVDASLRVEQLQEVFGAVQLDRAERTRIQTALQMAGLEPRPSLLEADPGTAIRFGPGENAPGPSPQPPQAPAAAPQDEAARDEFPTVGEFARST